MSVKINNYPIIASITILTLMAGLAVFGCSEGDDGGKVNPDDTDVDAGDTEDTSGDTETQDTGDDTGDDTEDTSGDTGEIDTNDDGGAGQEEAAIAFDSDVEGFSMAYSEPETLKEDSTLSHDPVEGNPKAGALKLTIPFTAVDQKVHVSMNPATPLDLSGKIVTVKVKLESGLTDDPSATGGAKVFLKSGAESDAWVDGGWNNLMATDGWIIINIDPEDPAYAKPETTFDPSAVTEIGIEIGTNSTEALSYSDAVVFIDSINY